MSDIKVGDRVSFMWPVQVNGKIEKRLTFGKVEGIHPVKGWAALRLDDGTRLTGFRLPELTVIAPTATELVQAIAALPQDDAVREQVVHDLRRAVDDYDFAVGQAGNLGGVELL